MWIRGKIEEVSEENMKKICGYHKLLMKVNDIMKTDFLSKEKQMTATGLKQPSLSSKTNTRPFSQTGQSECSFMN